MVCGVISGKPCFFSYHNEKWINRSFGNNPIQAMCSGLFKGYGRVFLRDLLYICAH